MSRTPELWRVVQPWGPDTGRQATLPREHATITEAFAGLDALADRMQRTGAPSDAIEVVVVDEAHQIISRPGAH
jgi:hypothetical protein